MTVPPGLKTGRKRESAKGWYPDEGVRQYRRSGVSLSLGKGHRQDFFRKFTGINGGNSTLVAGKGKFILSLARNIAHLCDVFSSYSEGFGAVVF